MNNDSIGNKTPPPFYNRPDRMEIYRVISPFYTFITEYGITIKFHYVGLVTNLLCIIVLSQKQMIHRKSIFYLLFLALSDFMYNFITLLPNLLVNLKIVNKDYHIFKTSDVSCFFYGYTNIIFHFYSVYKLIYFLIKK